MIEGQRIEWKHVWKDEYLAWICGFANADGGTIYIGKNDNGNITGVKNEAKLLEDIPNKIKNLLGIICDVNLHEESDKKYLEIIVDSYNVPISYKGKYYQRSGSTNLLLTDSSLTDFLLKKTGRTWDSVTVDKVSIEDIDQNAVNYFIKQASRSGRLPFIEENLSIEELLTNLDLLVDNGKLTRAGLLLFGKNVNRLFPTASVKIGRFGNSSTELLSQEVVSSNLVELADKVLEILDLKYFVKPISYEGLTRVETPPYPYEAIREILFNAIIHREYGDTNIFISLYDDRITIWNPGELTRKLSLEDLKTKHASYPRNKLLANVFYKAGFIEAWGRGTLKVYQKCQEYGVLEPKLEISSSGFSVTLFKKANGQVISNSSDNINLSQSQKKVVEYIEEHGFITASIHSGLFNVNDRTSRRQLNALVSMRILKKIGNNKNRQYELF